MTARTRSHPLWLAAVDPGVRRCGLAVFRDSELICASEPEHPTDVARVVVAAVDCAINEFGSVYWVAETPQDYPGKRRREGTLEQLREVIRAVGMLRTDIGPAVATRTPRKWKGNVPKEVHHKRILALLTPKERAIVEALPRDRDALDAVGLGLYELGRCGRGGRRIV